MNRDEKRKRVHKLCDEMRENDDALGRFSDHEGGCEGPTWQAFKDGYLSRRALEAISLHRKAIDLWGKLYNLDRHTTKPAAADRK